MINIIFLSALTFALSFIFNDFFFRSFGLSDYVSLLFIPSGIRIFFALVFDIYGVVGILLGSLLVSLFYLNQSDLTVVATTACVAAGAAWFARWASLTLLKLDINLAKTTWGDAKAGQTKAAACAACHGADGNPSDPQYPRLAGQSERYIAQQLALFKSWYRQWSAA